MPEPLDQAIDMAVRVEDSDRSKFIRNAIRDRLERLGIKTSEPLPE